MQLRLRSTLRRFVHEPISWGSLAIWLSCKSRTWQQVKPLAQVSKIMQLAGLTHGSADGIAEIVILLRPILYLVRITWLIRSSSIRIYSAACWCTAPY